MKKLNRLFALVLAMLMCVLLVFSASCKKDEPENTSTELVSSEEGDISSEETGSAPAPSEEGNDSIANSSSAPSSSEKGNSSTTSSSNNSSTTSSNSSSTTSPSGNNSSSSNSSSNTSSGNSGSSTPPASSKDVYQKTDYEVFDMGGDTIKFLSFYSIVAMGETASTEKGILAIERRKEIERKYNCKFYMEVVAQQYIVSSEIDAAHLAGDVRADIFCCFANGMKSLAERGMVYPISEAIDITRPQWNDAVTEVSMKYGKAYFISPDPTWTESLVSFRPKYLDICGIENPYELIKEGKWTTEKYVEICEKITRLLGGYQGVYGHNRVTKEPSISHFLGVFGTEWITQDKDGYYHSNLDDPKILEALNWLVRLNKTAAPETESGAINVFQFPASNSGWGNISVSDPAKENERYYCEAPLSRHITTAPNLCQQANARGMQSLLTDKRAKQIGTIYSYYCEPFGETETEEARITKDDWSARAYNPETVETVLKLSNKGSTMYKWTFTGGVYGLVDKAVSSALENGTDLAEAIDSVKAELKELLDEKNEYLDR